MEILLDHLWWFSSLQLSGRWGRPPGLGLETHEREGHFKSCGHPSTSAFERRMIHIMNIFEFALRHSYRNGGQVIDYHSSTRTDSVPSG